MLILNKEAVAESLSHSECIDALYETMISVSKRDVVMPLRQFISVPDTQGKFTMMPGYLGDPRCFGVKLVSKYPPEISGASHIGAVMVFDAEKGHPQAMLDGAELTAIRTSAATALATKALSREDSSVLTLLGCGEEAWHHVQAILAVRPIEKITVWGRASDRAQNFVDRCLQTGIVPETVSIAVEADAAKATEQADILCTLTASTQPILQGEWLLPGTHVNLVGAAVRTSAEADTEVVTKSRFYIDYRDSAMAQAGELLNAIDQGLVDEQHIVGEIGEVLTGQCIGRQSDEEITLYKSLGVSAQDLAAGLCAFQNAKQKGVGIEIPW